MSLASVSPSLRYFYEVAKAGSFRQAAERINIAASALNRQITLLEADLKVTLFERRPGRGRLRLTSAGEILLHRVRLSMNELDVARSAIDSLKGMKRGVVSLGVNDSISHDFLPFFLADFNKAYPHIDFQITVDNTLALLDLIERDEADAILAYNIPLRSNLRTVISFPLGMCVLVSDDHPLAQRETLRLSDCVGYPIAIPDDSMVLAQIQKQMLARMGDTRAILKTNSFELIRDVVASGMAISIQTHFLLSRDPHRRNVRSIPLTDSYRLDHALACCVRAGRELPVATAVLVEALKDSLLNEAKREQILDQE